MAYLYREALEKVPLFRNKHPQFIACIVPLLKLEYYPPSKLFLILPAVTKGLY